jgi:hAT family C-terminal dimerisation region
MSYQAKLNESFYYAAARIFDSCCRTRWLKDEDDHWKLNEEAKWRKVQALWMKFIRETSQETLRSYDRQAQSISDHRTISLEEMDAFQQLRAEQKAKQARSRSQDEFKNYCSQTSSHDLQNTTSIQWWTQETQQVLWSRLSILIINVLAISDMSDKSERVFSDDRRTISWNRSRFSMKTVEQTECLKNWKCQEILSQEFWDYAKISKNLMFLFYLLDLNKLFSYDNKKNILSRLQFRIAILDFSDRVTKISWQLTNISGFYRA